MKGNRGKELLQMTSSIKPSSSAHEKPPSELKTAPSRFMTDITGRDEAERRAEAAEAELAVVKATRRAKLSDLHEVPKRRRYKPPAQKAELRANMLKEGLISPLSVAIRPEGGYEIVVGHHRSDFAKEFHELGIEGWPDDIEINIVSNDGANRKAFYSNLFHESLPDFEKWEGLQALAIENDLKSFESIADFTGMAVSTVKKLARFGDLPKEAQDLLATKKDALGANAAEKLAKIAKMGKEAAVTAAIQSLISDPELTQDKAVQMAIDADKPKPADKPKAEVITIKSGRSNFCKMTPVGGTLRLDFNSEENRAAAQAIIAEALDKLAKLEK